MESDITKIKTIFTHMMDHKQHYSPENMYLMRVQDYDTVVLTNNPSPSLESVNSMKTGIMWTIKHEIGSPNLY